MWFKHSLIVLCNVLDYNLSKIITANRKLVKNIHISPYEIQRKAQVWFVSYSCPRAGWCFCSEYDQLLYLYAHTLDTSHCPTVPVTKELNVGNIRCLPIDAIAQAEILEFSHKIGQYHEDTKLPGLIKAPQQPRQKMPTFLPLIYFKVIYFD